jgi:hypothetical protein
MAETKDATSLHKRCGELFENYPEASGPGCTYIVLCVPGEPRPKAYILNRRKDRYFSITPYAGGSGAVITADTREVSAEYAVALASGVPFPRDGSLYGWVHAGVVTTLIAFYADTDDPEPAHLNMPRAGSDESGWPPFAIRGFQYGAWFWSARVPFGGAGVLAVTSPLTTPGGNRLEAGVYAYHEALRGGEPSPTLAEVLADPDKIDLSARF